MNTRTLRGPRTTAPVQRLVLALLAATALYADTTVTFQNGASGYAGSKDVSINTQYSQYNGGNGVRWTGDPELGCYTTTGTDSYSVRYLLQFGGLTIPAGSKVVSASLRIAVDSWNNGSGNITGFYLKNAWSPDSARLGWLHRNDTQDWAAGGAASAGVDTVSGKSFRLPGLQPVGVQAVNVALDAAVVQSWIDSPATVNQGIMLVNNNPGEIMRFVSTVGTQGMRPKLTIVIASATTGVQVSLNPTSVTLNPGQTQQFTSTVTGSTNTAVTWSATGGTISSTGLFTAGSTAGSTFAVTATSAADTTRKATAAVSVRAISVTISPKTVTLNPGQTQQFSATVSGTTNTAVTWTATGGTISSSGLFTAGSTTGTSFTVTAASVANTAKKDTATVTIQAPAVISVTISPKTATLNPGQTQQFAATVSGTANTAVTWTATGGTISSSGLFTAGSTAGTAFTVTAASVADTTKKDTATVTVQAPPAISVTISPKSTTVNTGQTQQFTAAVSGSANTAVTWTATGGTISSSGLYTAGTSVGSFSVTAKSAADPTKSDTATVSVVNNGGLPGLPPVPRQSDGAYVVIQSPVTGMHFAAPGSIRIYADPHDGNAADPDALTVTYLLNGQVAGTFTGSGAQNGYFPFNLSNLTAGTYTITAQITASQRVVTSVPVVVFVDNPATSSGPVFNLTADVVLSGSQSVTYAGTALNRCSINGNGFQIRAAAGFTGSLNISNCDIRNLGAATVPGIDVTVNSSGSVQLTGNVFETFGTIAVGANDQAQAVVRNNEFRENTLVPVTSLPVEYSNATLPVFKGTGSSTAQQYFQGNNVGLSTVVFENTRNWLIGGSTDAESNVLMGVRCGFTITGSSNMVLRGNYSQHNYPHRFSQGENFELEGGGFLAEHNVIRSSSWPVRGFGGELRYNLIDASGNSDQVLQAPMSNANIHHNIFSFTVSQTLYSPGTALDLIYDVDNVLFNNNVMDGGGTFMAFYGNPITVTSGSFLGSLRNNVFYNFASQVDAPVLSGALGESTNPPLQRLRYADYNDFFNPDAANQTNYGLGVIGKTPGTAGYGMHDLGGFNGHADPKFAQPTAIPFPFLPQDIWSRTKKVSDVLATYRAMYTPGTGSPLKGAGDPQDGAGGNIGAIGNGEATDQFGRFGGGSTIPGSPVISSFSAAASTIQPGQSTALNWSVTGATSLSIAPGVGTVTGSSVTVTPSATTTYTLTATNSAGSAAATTTVTVSSTPVVSVTISPLSATVAIGAAKQFTATVSGTTNTAVVWTATGGSINSSGLYTAGATAGSFTVTATSVQDSTKGASAAITISAPQPVSVTVAPTSTTVFVNGTQQFTATVSNATNTAVTWTATGGTISSGGLYTAGATSGSFAVTATSVQDTSKSASASVAVVTATSTGHPRMILDAPTLAALRTRAQNRTAEWTALKAVCDSFTGGGTVNFPGENGYPNPPSVGEGYQGSGYVEAILPLSLCYQTTRLSDPAAAAQYGSKAVAVLMAMSDPNHTIVDGRPVWDRDSGYGIRNFGFAMGMGYDWVHDLLTPAQQAQLQTSLDNWIRGFENDSFEYDHPQGNYFAGYYVSKCLAALAVEGDSTLATTWWNDWYNNQHLQRVAPYYAANLGGGGWTEGFMQYGILGSKNQAIPALAVRTAKGIDLVHSGPVPYPYPLDQARYLMAFTWPTKSMMDDRGELYDTGDPTIWPGTTRLEIYRFFAGYLAMWNDPLAPMMHKYARDTKTALDALQAGDSTEWNDFLFWDSSAPETTDYSSLPLSYLAPGVGGVAARSDWTTNAAFMTFMSSPYINNPAAGHEGFDKGSLAIEKNRNPLVVNPAAWLTHEPNGGAGWTATFDDRYGNWDIDHTLGNRRLYNTFQVRHLDSQGGILDNYGQWAIQRSDGARTKIGRFEDGGSYVLTVGQFLEDEYRPFQTICAGRSPITSWSRQIVYLRPTSQYVVYDRTDICDASLDQYLAFHFPANPVETAPPATGVRRFDINPGVFAGAMTTILPASAQINITDHLSTDSSTWGKMWRTEVRAATGTTGTARRWMTVFDLAVSSGQVASATGVTINSGPAVGALLRSSTGNSAVIAGTADVGTAISGTLSYVVPAAQTHHVVTDLTPSSGYTVSVAVSGGNHTVTITAGGSRNASANGVLDFQVSATGSVTP